MMSDSALDLLQRDEICVVVLHDGTKREATWSPHNRGFYLRPPGEVRFVPHAEVFEWWPAAVKF
jgi:hypothetical protein